MWHVRRRSQVFVARQNYDALSFVPQSVGSKRIMTQNLTNTKLPGLREYRKTATIHAVQIDEPFVVDTLEGTFTGKTGDWLAEGAEGERSIIDNTIFKKTYTEV